MNNLNSIIVEGNLTRDPDLRQTPKGTQVCRFTLATNRYYKVDGIRQEEVSYFDVETWARLAETCGEYLCKGRGVRVVGRLKQDRWVNTQGEPRSKIHIVGDHVEFRSKPKSAGGQEKDEDKQDKQDKELDTASVAAETPESPHEPGSKGHSPLF